MFILNILDYWDHWMRTSSLVLLRREIILSADRRPEKALACFAPPEPTLPPGSEVHGPFAEASH